MLSRWVADLADQPVALACWLGASEIGRPLYRSVGSEDVETSNINLGTWEGEGIHRHCGVDRNSACFANTNASS